MSTQEESSGQAKPWISLGLNIITQQIIVMSIWKEKPENPIPSGLNEEELGRE